MHETRLAFLAAAAEARAVLVLAEVEERWNEPSALAGMTVGALAGHLVRPVATVQTYLAAPVSADEEPITAAAYFASIDTLSDFDSETNVAIRARADDAAKEGCHALIESFDGYVTELRHALATEPDDRLVQVYGDMVLPLDEYLLTRILELTIHTDDLCASIGTPTPALSGLHLTISLLVDVAEIRHGELAVLHALARRERDAGNVLRVL